MISARDLRKFVDQLMAPLKRRVMLMIGRSVILATKNDEGVQKVQTSLYAGETKDDMELFQHYGFTSVPPPNTAGIAVFPQGNRDEGIVIATENRFLRLQELSTGDVALYDAVGNKIVLKQTSIDIECVGAVNVTSTTAKIDSPSVEIGQGALESVLKGETFQALFNSHTHVGNLGFNTTPPVTPSTPLDLSVGVKTGV